MERFLSLTKSRDQKVPEILTFLSKIDEDPNSVFFEVANFLNKSNSLNPTYTLTSYQDIINSIRELIDKMYKPTANDDSSSNSIPGPEDTYRWLYLIVSIATRKVSDDSELETAKIDFFLNAFYDFVILAVNFNPECQLENGIANKLLLLSGLFCAAARIINYSKRAIDHILSEAFLEKIVKLLEMNLNTLIGDDAHKVSIYQFSHSAIFELVSPMNKSELPLFDLFYDVDLYIKFSVLRFLYHLFNVTTKINDNDKNKLRSLIVPFFDHDILATISQKVLSLLYNGDSQISVYCNQNFENFGKVIIDFCKSSDNFTKTCFEKEEQFAIALNKAFHLANNDNNQQYIEQILKDNQEVGKSLEILLCSPFYDFFYVYQSAAILSTAKWQLSNFKTPLHILLMAPKRLQREIQQLLKHQGELIVPDLLEMIPKIPKYGSKSMPFFNLITSIIPTLTNPMQIISCLFKTLDEAIEITQANPEFELHHKLSEYINVNSYCFENCFCESCLNYEKDFSILNLEIPFNKSHTKLSHNTIAYRFSNLESLSSVTLDYSLKSNSKLPRVVSLFICQDEIKDIKSNSNQWIPPFSDSAFNHFYFPYQQKSSNIMFPKDITATGIMIKIEEFWYQCENTTCKHQCHNLISESIFCTDCGQSSYISLSLSIKYREISAFSNVTNTKSLENSIKESNSLIRSVESTFRTMYNLNQSITSILSNNAPILEKKSSLDDLYNNKVKKYYYQISSSLIQIRELKIHSGKFSNRLINHYINVSSGQICVQCYLTFIHNCFKTFSNLQGIKAKDEVPFLKLIYDSMGISNLVMKYISSNFADDLVDMVVTFSKVVPEITKTISDLFISSLPSTNPTLIWLLCSLLKIDDQYIPNRFTQILPALIKSISFINSDPTFSMCVLQPLLSTICSSPAIISKPSVYNKYQKYNQWKKLLNKPPSPLFTALSMFPNEEIWTSLLFNSTSEKVRELTKQLLRKSSLLSPQLYKQVYSFAEKFIDKELFGEINSNHQQYFDLLLQLISLPRQIVKLLHSDFLDKLVVKFSSEIKEIISKESDSFIFDPNCGRSIFIVFQFLYLFLRSTINLRYVIHRKQNLAVTIFSDYFKLRSLIYQRSKYLYDTLQLMKTVISQMISTELVLIDDIEKLNKDKKAQSNPPQNREEPRSEIALDHYESLFSGQSLESLTPSEAIALLLLGHPLHRDASENNENEHIEEEDQNKESEQDTEEIMVENPCGPRILLKAGAEATSVFPDIVIRELSSFLFPPRAVESIPIILKKWRNHQDFLPGQLSRDPIMSDQIGETFRDIRTKFAILLDIHEFMQEDNSTELLVDNNIIALNLPISEVYKRIWVPSRGNTPMEVYCRVTGLDGDATEPMINSFPSESKNQLPPEVQFEFTTVLCEDNGFLPLLESLDFYSFTNTDDKKIKISKEALNDLIKLLETFVLVKQNRIEINRLNGLGHLFRLIKNLLDSKTQGNRPVRTSSSIAIDMALGLSTTAALRAAALTSKEMFKRTIAIANALIQEDPTSIKNPQDWVTLILKSLASSFFRNNENLVSPFLSLLPPIAAQSQALMELVLAYFVDQLIPSTKDAKKKPKGFNIYENCQSLYTLNGLAEFVMVIPPNQLGNIIKDRIIKENIVVDAISALYHLFPPEEPQKRHSEKWKSSLDKPFLPSLLKVLIGMCKCHPKTQELFLQDDCKFIQFLLELEPITSKENIGEFAGDILSTSEIEPSLCKEPIERIKNQKKQAARAKAQATKEAVIQNANPISAELQAQLDDLQDQSLECVICHEGYEFKPQEILGVYVYVNRASKSSGSKSSKFNDPLLQFLAPSSSCIKDIESQNNSVFNTATYFVCIHPSCHRIATETLDRRHAGPGDTFIEHSESNVPDLINHIMIMDKGTEYRAKPPNQLSSEWEAAALRNSERPCNAIFPLPFISLNQNDYKQALIDFVENSNQFDKQSQKLTVKALIDFKSMMLDCRTHLVLTALNEKIPLQLGGGSLSSIAALLPFIINAGHILLDMDSEASLTTTTARAILEKEIGESIASLKKPEVKKEGIVDIMAMSIWLLSLEEWNYLKLDFLKLLIGLTLKQNEEINTTKLRSILLFYIILSRIQTMVKKSSGNPVKKSENESRILIGPYSHKTPWISEFRAHVEIDPATVEAEWTDFGNELQEEILDVTELKDLLAYAEVHCDNPDEFIRSCILS